MSSWRPTVTKRTLNLPSCGSWSLVGGPVSGHLERRPSRWRPTVFASARPGRLVLGWCCLLLAMLPSARSGTCRHADEHAGRQAPPSRVSRHCPSLFREYVEEFERPHGWDTDEVDGVEAAPGVRLGPGGGSSTGWSDCGGATRSSFCAVRSEWRASRRSVSGSSASGRPRIIRRNLDTAFVSNLGSLWRHDRGFPRDLRRGGPLADLLGLRGLRSRGSMPSVWLAIGMFPCLPCVALGDARTGVVCTAASCFRRSWRCSSSWCRRGVLGLVRVHSRVWTSWRLAALGRRALVGSFCGGAGDRGVALVALPMLAARERRASRVTRPSWSSVVPD